MCTLFTWEFCGPWDTYEGVTHEFLIKQTLERKFRKIIYPFGQILLCTFSPSSFMGHGIPMRGMGHGPWDTYEGVTHEFLTKQTLERKFRKIITLLCTFSHVSSSKCNHEKQHFQYYFMKNVKLMEVQGKKQKKEKMEKNKIQFWIKYFSSSHASSNLFLLFYSLYRK